MITIEPYNPTWPDSFATTGKALRELMGDDALAIHHIGSTSVPNLAAKNIIDIQLTVRDYSLPFQSGLESLGFTYRKDIQRDHCPPGMTLATSDLEKRFFKRLEPASNLHVRVSERFNQRYPLLCRDYLRATPVARDAYSEIKQQLARYFPEDVTAYYDIKDPLFDVIMAGALNWAAQTDWQLPPSDA